MRNLFFIFILLISSLSQASLFSWKGNYRFEYLSIGNKGLGLTESDKSYALHHLVLRPQLIIRDGVSFDGRFHIFNCIENHCVNNANQFGQFLGSGGGGGSFFDSDVLSQTQASDHINVGDFYATFSHRYGVIKAGRIPIHFGLGIAHNSGYGEFDHWYDTRDMISYETSFGNLNVLFGYGKFSEGQLNVSGDDLSEYNLKIQYNSYEKGIETGFYYQSRTGGSQANDLPDNEIGDGKNAESSVSSKYWNIYARKKLKKLDWAVESSFHRGQSGLTKGGSGITFRGFAVVGDVKLVTSDASRFRYQLKAGVVSGDDPNTEGAYEGYYLDRNYDVALILFNQPLGLGDALGTEVFYPKKDDGTSRRTEFPGSEAVTNAYFIAPSVEFRWKQNWTLKSTFLAAFNQRDYLNQGNTLGYELDLAAIYKPSDSLQWIFQGGYLMAGSAFGGDSNPWGWGMKLSMSF